MTKLEAKQHIKDQLNYIENYSSCKYSFASLCIIGMNFDIKIFSKELKKEGIYFINKSKNDLFYRFSKFEDAENQLHIIKELKRKNNKSINTNIELPLPFRKITIKELNKMVCKMSYEKYIDTNNLIPQVIWDYKF